MFGKGKKHRKSYLNARAIIALHKYITSRESDSEYVFTSEKKPSNPIHARTVQTTIRSLGEKAGIQGRVYPHRIRHTTATDALSRGMAIEQVQTLLGHEKTSTTLIYAKINQTGVKMESLRCIPGPGMGQQNSVLFGDATFKQLNYTFIGTPTDWDDLSSDEKSFYRVVVLDQV